MNSPPVAKNRSVLIVDGDQSVHDFIRQRLTQTSDRQSATTAASNQFTVDSAYQDQEALSCVRRAIAESRPYAVAFIDARATADGDCIDTVMRLWELDADLQVVICTSGNDLTADSILRRTGDTDRLFALGKPLDPLALQLTAFALVEKRHVREQRQQELHGLRKWVGNAQRVLDILQQSHQDLESAHRTATNRATELTEMVQQRTIEAIATRDMAVFAMAQLTESRDPETGEHLQRMRAYTQVLAEHLAHEGPYADQFDEQFLEDLYRSSPLHDIGKVGVPDKILLKPGPLTPDELVVMRQHTTLGADALLRAARQSEYGAFLELAAAIARSHHERFDGSGYPDGLKGEEIPLAARIVALADVFDALTSVRVYKDAMDPELAKQFILVQDGEHFDPVVVDAFRACYDKFLEVHAANQPPEPAVASSQHSLDALTSL